MSLNLFIVFFFGSSITAVLGSVFGSTAAMISGVIGMLLSGTYITLIMGLRRSIYVATFFVFHLAMAGFTAYIYLNRDHVLRGPEFTFDTFTDENLRTALVALVATLTCIVLPWFMIVRRQFSLLRLSPYAAMVALMGPIGSVRRVVIQAILFASLIVAIVIVMTNTTVLEQPYPLNSELQNIPGELFKIPILLAAVALGISYFKHFQRRSSESFTLFVARINFIVTPILMLLVMGARAMCTLLWLFVGLLELFYFIRKNNTVIWAACFLALAWFSFYSWPYLRVNLSSMPADAALQQAFDIGTLRSDELPSRPGIDLDDFPMIGTSLFHMLYVIELTKGGITLGGATFVNLIPQFVPDFLDGVLLDRPINDAWRLASYYPHGGGFFAIANAYWNGGLAVMCVCVLVVSLLFIGFDRYFVRARTGVLYKTVYWLWLPIMLTQLGYGLQGLARVVELLAVMVLIDQLKPKKYFRSMQ